MEKVAGQHSSGPGTFTADVGSVRVFLLRPSAEIDPFPERPSDSTAEAGTCVFV